MPSVSGSRMSSTKTSGWKSDSARAAAAPFVANHPLPGSNVYSAPGAIVVGVLNWNTYVEAVGTYASHLTRISRYLADQPPSTRAYLISANYTPKVREFEFLIPDRLVANLTPEEVDSDIPRIGAPTLLIITEEQRELVPQLQQIFPNGSAETHAGNSPTEVAFYVFRLPK